jgi:hypothetical protein
MSWRVKLLLGRKLGGVTGSRSVVCSKEGRPVRALVVLVGGHGFGVAEKSQEMEENFEVSVVLIFKTQKGFSVRGER